VKSEISSGSVASSLRPLEMARDGFREVGNLRTSRDPVPLSKLTMSVKVPPTSTPTDTCPPGWGLATGEPTPARLEAARLEGMFNGWRSNKDFLSVINDCLSTCGAGGPVLPNSYRVLHLLNHSLLVHAQGRELFKEGASELRSRPSRRASQARKRCAGGPTRARRQA